MHSPGEGSSSPGLPQFWRVIGLLVSVGECCIDNFSPAIFSLYWNQARIRLIALLTMFVKSRQRMSGGEGKKIDQASCFR